MIFVHCTLSHCQKHAYQAWSHLKLWLQSYAPDKKCSVKSIKGEKIKNGTRWSYGSCAVHFESLPKTCIPCLESFGPTMTKLRSAQGKRDKADADTDVDATNQSNTYMSPFQTTQKHTVFLFLYVFYNFFIYLLFMIDCEASYPNLY